MPKERIQQSLFADNEVPEKWEEEWNGMPEFTQEDLTSYQQIIVHFQNKEDLQKFGNLIGKKLTYKTRSIWYPEAEIGRIAGRLYINENE